MLKEQLEYRLSKGTRKGEGVRSSIIRFRLNEIVGLLNDNDALVVDHKFHVKLDRVAPTEQDKIRTFLLSDKCKSSAVSPFADLPFGIRHIYHNDGPLHFEAAGDVFDKIPWILTVTIVEAIFGWIYEWAQDAVYLPSSKGPKRMKNVGLFYEHNRPVAAMYNVESYNGRTILVKWLQERKKILVRYQIVSADSKDRLGQKYLVDFEMFCPPWVKERAMEILTPFETDFKDKYELTLAETKKKLTVLLDQ